MGETRDRVTSHLDHLFFLEITVAQPSQGAAIHLLGVHGATMARTLATFPSEVLEQILSLVCNNSAHDINNVRLINHFFNALATPISYRTSRRTSNDVGCFAPIVVVNLEKDPQHYGLLATPPQIAALQSGRVRLHLRHLDVDLLSFLGAAQYCTVSCGHRFAGFSMPFQAGRHYSYGRDWMEKLNADLAQLAGVMPTLQHLKTFRLKAQRLRQVFSCCSDSPFLREQTLCSLMRGLRSCKELHELEIDTEDAEILASNNFRHGQRSCEEHACSVLARTVEVLPRLKVLRVRRAELCSSCLGFTDLSRSENDAFACTHRSLLETIILDLRMPDTIHVLPGIYEARSRHCHTECKCSLCTHHCCREHSAAIVIDCRARADRMVGPLCACRKPAFERRYNPWRTAYVPATPNVFAQWTNVVDNTGAPTHQQQEPPEVERWREYLMTFVSTLLEQISAGALPHAKEVKVVINAHGAACNHRGREPTEIDCLKREVIKKYDSTMSVENFEVDCEGTALCRFLVRSRTSYSGSC